MCSELDQDQGSGGQSLEVLERKITELASHISAATCRWLCLVAEYDRREGWAPWGCRSCAHWVSWRCGIGPGAAREHVRVANRLQELPLVRGAFAQGQLTYSKVRALTRVDNIEREQDLLDLARHATAAQLERLVRAYRGVVAAERSTSGDRPQRWLTWSHDDDGSLLLRGRLPAEEGALLIEALEAARERLQERTGDDQPPPIDRPPPAESTPTNPQNRAAPTTRDVSAETPDPPPASAPTTRDVSAQAPGVSSGAAAAGERRPVLEPAICVGEERADALVLLADGFLAGDPADRSGGDRYQVVVHVDTDSLRGRARGDRCELESEVPLAAETVRRLACDAAIVPLVEHGGEALDVGRKRRTIPPAMRRALAARDRGCRFPGCGARRCVEAHHIEHWANGGKTRLSNLVQLCRHHHRLLHEGGCTVERQANGDLTFRRGDGRRIVACPRPPRGETAALRARRRAIAHDACVSLSAGERLDLDLGVQAMLTFAPPPSSEPPGV
jgi:Domain of unknown function (DUF222)/HNH endonuclease